MAPRVAPTATPAAAPALRPPFERCTGFPAADEVDVKVPRALDATVLVVVALALAVAENMSVADAVRSS